MSDIRNPVIAGAIIAAGMSRRLGQPKQLLRIHDQPVLQYVIDALQASGVDRRAIVLGHAANEITDVCNLSGLEIISNSDYEKGQGTSVAAAARYYADNADALIVVLSDQPMISPDVINLLVSTFRVQRDDIIQPQYADGPGNPVLIPAKYFPILSTLDGDEGARKLLKSPDVPVKRVSVSEVNRPLDIDTWEEYRNVAALMGDDSVNNC